MPDSLSVFYLGVPIPLEYVAWCAINRGSQIPYETGHQTELGGGGVWGFRGGVVLGEWAGEVKRCEEGV